MRAPAPNTRRSATGCRFSVGGRSRRSRHCSERTAWPMSPATRCRISSRRRRSAWPRKVSKCGCAAAISFGATNRAELTRLGPALGKGKGASAERTAFALQWPSLPLRVDAVARQARAKRRDQQRADAIFAAALAGVRMNEQRLADLVPGQRDILARGVDALGPEITRVALLAER